jgi:hypothetical protein
LAKEHGKGQLHLRVAEETHEGFSLLPDRCKFISRKNEKLFDKQHKAIGQDASDPIRRLLLERCLLKRSV